MAARIDRIPVTLLTGFLGSGKTTLLQRLLRAPAFAGTAVLVNELGEVGLDHHLVRGASETMRVLENGCVCCSVRDDLQAALADLYWDRLHQRIPRFARVVIETTGLAYPGPVLRLLQGSGIVAERYRWANVVCTVDATNAVQQLATRMEARRQVALADVILVTKTDLADGASVAAVERTLRSRNAFAPRFHVTRGEASPEVLDLIAARAPVPGRVPLRRVVPSAAALPVASGAHMADVHGADVRTFAIGIAPRSRARLAQLLDAIARRHGTALLRMKGVVRVTDAAQLQVVQGVHDRVHPLEDIEGEADDAAVGTLVFIATAADGAGAAALEAGVRDLIDAADVLRD